MSRFQRNLRLVKDYEIKEAKQKIFGTACGLPGERWLRRPLEGKKLTNYYFPSKFTFQDFRLNEYFEMQAERYLHGEEHTGITKFNDTIQKALAKRPQVEKLLASCTPEILEQHASLRDLQQFYVVYDTMFGNRENVSNAVFSSEEEEISFLMSSLSEKMKKEDFKQLRLEIQRTQSSRAVKNMLLDEIERRGITLPYTAAQLSVTEGETVVGASEELAGHLMTVSEVSAEETALEDGDPFAFNFEKERFEAPEATAKEDEPKRYTNVVASAEFKPRTFSLGVSPQKPSTVNPDAAENLAKVQAEQRAGRLMRRRHRFVDPMYRRRRLKWLERVMTGMHKEKELKFNDYYIKHPDNITQWPTNKGSVTVMYPSPFHAS